MLPAARRSALFVLLGVVPLVAAYACGDFGNDTAPPADAGPVDETGNDAAPGETSIDAPPAEDAGVVRGCRVHAIATGTVHSCAVFGESNNVACWGDNSAFESGGDDAGFRLNARLVRDLDHVVQLALGNSHSCALKSDGTVWCWGGDDLAQLGNAVATTTPTAVPTKVFGIKTATQISAGYSHTCARLSDGAVSCWGANARGQHGDGTLTSSFAPTHTAISDVVEVRAAAAHSCARLTDAGIVCWGDNFYGTVGTGADDAGPDASAIGYAHPTPLLVDAGPAVALHAGEYATCGQFASEPALRCWGNNFAKILVPNAPASNVYTPTGVTIPFTLDGGDVAIGAFQTCAVDSDGLVFCWGDSSYGQAGDSKLGGPPTLVTAFGAVDHVSTGYLHTCVQADASVSCVGWNEYGQLGRGTIDVPPADGGNTPAHPMPVRVALPCL